MKVKALRGVCIGVDRHLKAGDVEDLEPALVTYLVSIKAVTRDVDESQPPKTEAIPVKTVPEKSGTKEK